MRAFDAHVALGRRVEAGSRVRSCASRGAQPRCTSTASPGASSSGVTTTKPARAMHAAGCPGTRVWRGSQRPSTTMRRCSWPPRRRARARSCDAANGRHVRALRQRLFEARFLRGTIQLPHAQPRRRRHRHHHAEPDQPASQGARSCARTSAVAAISWLHEGVIVVVLMAIVVVLASAGVVMLRKPRDGRQATRHAHGARAGAARAAVDRAVRVHPAGLVAGLDPAERACQCRADACKRKGAAVGALRRRRVLTASTPGSTGPARPRRRSASTRPRLRSRSGAAA